MYVIEQPSVLVGVSDLRGKLGRLLNLAKTSRVILSKRNAPLAVLVPVDKFDRMEALIDGIEDAVLGYEALQRGRTTPRRRYLTLDEAEKRVGLKRKRTGSRT